MRIAAVLALGIELLLPAMAAGQRVDSTRSRSDSSRIGTVADSAAVHGLTPVLAPVTVAGTRLSARTDRRAAARVDAVSVRNSVPGPARVEDALSVLPGVNLTNDQGSRAQPTVEFRGFTLSPVAGVPQGVSVFLDGIRVNEPDAQEVNFDLLPTDAVDHAELLRGPSAIFGKNTLGGALSLSTIRGGVTPHAVVTAETGSFGYNSFHLLASGARGGFDAVLSGVASREDGYQLKSGSTTGQIFSTVGKQTGRSDLALSLLYARDEVYEAGSLPQSWLRLDPRANYSAGDFFRPDVIQVALRGSRSLSRSTLRGNIFTRHNATEQFNVNAQDPDTRAFVRNQSLGGTTEFDIPATLVGLPLGLSIGGEYAHTAVAYRVFGEPNLAAPNGSPDCDAQSRLCEDARVNGDDAALFAQGILQLTGRLSFLVAARGDEVRVPFRDLKDPENSGTNTFRHLSPKLGLTYVSANHLRIYGSAGSGFRAPAALELACASPSAPCPLPFSLGADPPLKPVIAWNSELGTDWEPGRSTAIHLSLFQERVRDEIVFVSSETAAGYFKNIGRTLRQGLEASGDFTPGHGVTLFASYAFLNATYQSAAVLSSALGNDSVTAGDQLALTPRHVGNAGIRSTNVFHALLLDATLSAHVVSSQFLRGDEANRTEPLPGYAVARLQVSLERTHARLTVDVDNLLDRRYEVFGVYATNVKGIPGAPPLGTPVVERFLSPSLPRSITISVAVTP